MTTVEDGISTVYLLEKRRKPGEPTLRWRPGSLPGIRASLQETLRKRLKAQRESRLELLRKAQPELPDPASLLPPYLRQYRSFVKPPPQWSNPHHEWYRLVRDQFPTGSLEWFAADTLHILEIVLWKVGRVPKALDPVRHAIILGQRIEHIYQKQKVEPTALPAIRGRKKSAKRRTQAAQEKLEREHREAASIWRKKPTLSKRAVADLVAGYMTRAGTNGVRTPERIARALPARAELLSRQSEKK